LLEFDYPHLQTAHDDESTGLLQHKRHLKAPDNYNKGVQDAVGKERAIPADDYIIASYNLNPADAGEEDNLDYSSVIDDSVYFADIQDVIVI